MGLSMRCRWRSLLLWCRFLLRCSLATPTLFASWRCQVGWRLPSSRYWSISSCLKAPGGICAKVGHTSRSIRQSDHHTVGQPRAAVDGGGTRRRPASCSGAIAILLGLVRPGPTTLDDRRHPQWRLRWHRLLPYLGAAAQGFGRSRLSRQRRVRADLTGLFCGHSGKAVTGFLMEIIGRRRTIAYALAGSLPGLCLLLMAHQAGNYAAVVMVAGALITGFTVLSPPRGSISRSSFRRR